MGIKGTLDKVSIVLSAVALIISSVQPSAASVIMGGTPVLSKETVDASGRQEALLKVPAPGRYAVKATSDQGTAVSIINKMTGPGPSSGEPGEENGRIDILLDEGEYKIITRSHKDGSGMARLQAFNFTELNAPGIPALIENKPVDEQMGDLQQRSYWLRLTGTTNIIVEAAGRNLTDLRLWKDGSWLYDISPSTETLEPVPGKPLRAFRLAIKLDRGLYLLTAYGGPSEAWAEDDNSHPFYLRYGIPDLPEAGRKRFEIGPLGIDRFRIPAQASYYRLELPESVKASLTVGGFSPSRPFNGGGRTATITKKSRLPVAEISSHSGSGYDLVTIKGTAGQPYILQHFDARRQRQIRMGGRYWLSTIHSGDPHDSVDATSLLFYTGPRGEPVFVDDDTMEAGHGTAITRRFNLLERLTVYLKILQPGLYTVHAPDSDISAKIEPFMLRYPRDYRTPDLAPPGKKWDLEKGFHILTLNPNKKGIVDLTITGERTPSGVLDRAMEFIKGVGPQAGGGDTAQAGLQTPANIYPAADLQRNRNYNLYINDQGDVHAGVILRSLPLDLSDALPLSLKPRQVVSIPFRLQKGHGTIKAVDEDGSPLELSLDGHSWTASVRSGKGTTLQVRNPTDDLKIASVWLEEDWNRPETPLPPLPPEALKELPDFTVIDDSAPLYFDLGRRGNRTFLIKVPQAAFYNLESTGLLATEGNVRARIITSIGRDSGSGTGRNFFVGRYLREGVYQVTVATRGQSTGHLGLGLTRSGLLSGGGLREGIPARVTLPEGQGIVYTLKITKPGTYRMTGYGLGRVLPFRFEDFEGWPLIAPDKSMDRTMELDEGLYRIVLLPEKVRSKRVIMVRRVESQAKTTGHGPHAIQLNSRNENIWMEPEEGGKRRPDIWTFELSAAADIALSITGEMEGRLIGTSGKSGDMEPLPVPTTGWKGRLEEGSYRFEAVCSRINNRVPYRLDISTDTLLPDLSRQATAPVDIPISVGTSGLVELSSFGKEDVRARIVSPDGITVAAQDDRPDDWNFQISSRLEEGQYTLKVRPVGSRRASFTTTMEVLGSTTAASIQAPARVQITPTDGVTLVPIKVRDGGAVRLTAGSDENIGVALERELGFGHRETVWSDSGTTVGTIIPLAGQQPDLSLRLWSLDRRNLPVSVSIDLMKAVSVPESSLAKGYMAPVEDGAAGRSSLLAVETTRPGLFKAKSMGRTAMGADSPLKPVTLAADGFLRAGEEGLWISVTDARTMRSDSDHSDETGTSDLGMGMDMFPGDTGSGQDSIARIQAQRYILSNTDTVQLALAPGEKVTMDVQGSDGPIMVEATSLAGNPGMTLTKDAKENNVVMAVARRSAAAILSDSKAPAARVFNAGDAFRKMDLKLKRHTYAKPRPEELSWGQVEGLLGDAKARAAAYIMPAGSKRIRISASVGVAAALIERDRVVSVSWAGDEALDELITSEADRILLLLAREEPARFALEVLPHSDNETIRPVAVSNPMEHMFIDGGTVRIPVKGQLGTRLRIGGTVEEAILVTSRGRVMKGSDLPLAEEDSELIVRHGPGHVMAWIEDESGKTGLWALKNPSSDRKISKAGTVPLSGSSAGINLKFDEPSVVHIRTPLPVVTRSEAPGSIAVTDVHPEGGRLDLYLPEGRGEVWMRGIGNQDLNGLAQISFTPVIRTGEGLGPEVLIPGGGTRFFSFTTDRSGRIGIGVRGDSDVVRCSLMDTRGTILGEGVVQMPTLDPGEYLIKLSVPPSKDPVRSRPAVVGLKLPGTGPPEEEIRKYLDLAGVKGGR